MVENQAIKERKMQQAILENKDQFLPFKGVRFSKVFRHLGVDPNDCRKSNHEGVKSSAKAQTNEQLAVSIEEYAAYVMSNLLTVTPHLLFSQPP